MGTKTDGKCPNSKIMCLSLRDNKNFNYEVCKKCKHNYDIKALSKAYIGEVK